MAHLGFNCNVEDTIVNQVKKCLTFHSFMRRNVQFKLYFETTIKYNEFSVRG